MSFKFSQLFFILSAFSIIFSMFKILSFSIVSSGRSLKLSINFWAISSFFSIKFLMISKKFFLLSFWISILVLKSLFLINSWFFTKLPKTNLFKEDWEVKSAIKSSIIFFICSYSSIAFFFFLIWSLEFSIAKRFAYFNLAAQL